MPALARRALVDISHLMLTALLLAQAMMSAPVTTQPASAPPADHTKLSIVVADTVSETDPQPLCAADDCTSLFLGRYRDAVTLAGPPMSAEFAARVEMGSSFNMSYRLALIVEARDGREPLVRAMAGFNDRTHEACFDWKDTEGWGWKVAGPRITMRRDVICVTG